MDYKRYLSIIVVQKYPSQIDNKDEQANIS